eukprot:scaffold29819_cov31-Tisochrysis_lutea.AAC.5
MERRAMRIDDVLAVWTPAKTQGIRGLGFMAKRRPHLFVMLMMAHISEQSPKDIRLTHQVSKSSDDNTSRAASGVPRAGVTQCIRPAFGLWA